MSPGGTSGLCGTLAVRTGVTWVRACNHRVNLQSPRQNAGQTVVFIKIIIKNFEIVINLYTEFKFGNSTLHFYYIIPT